MAVSIVGYKQLALSSGPSGSVALGSWPAGTAVSDLAVMLVVPDSNTWDVPAGWSSASRWMAWRLLSAADVAGSVPAAAVVGVAGVVVFRGASGVGFSSNRPGATVAAGGAVVSLGFGGDGAWKPKLVASVESQGTVVEQTPSQGVNTYGAFAEVNAAGGWTEIATRATGSVYVSLPLLPATVPAAPSLLAPAPGSQAAVGAVELSWLHRSQAGGVQDSARVQVRLNGGAWQWVTAAGGLSSTVQTLAQSTPSKSVTLSAGSWEWAVETGEAGWWSPLSPIWALSVVAPPVVSATPTVVCPAGDLTPDVSWTATVGTGAVQVVQVVITAGPATDPSAALWSGTWNGAPATVTTGPLSTVNNGASLKAWVRVAQTGGLWSAWRASDWFEVSWTPPASPTLSVAGTAPVTLTVAAAGPGVQVQTDTGSGWVDIMETTGSSVVWPRAPYGSAAAYRARTWTLADGVRLWSAWSGSVSATSTETRHWLVGEDGTSLQVPLAEDSDHARVQGVAVAYGLPSTLGESRPWVDSTPPAGEAGTIVVRAESVEVLDGLLAWLDAHPVMWICWPPEWMGSARVARVPTRAARSGPLSISRLAQAPVVMRQVTIPWVQQ